MQKLRKLICLGGLIFSGFAYADPVSLGFESGLAGFTFAGQGNAAAISSLGPISPLFGGSMGFLSNGPGDLNGSPDLATLISDAFTLNPSDTLVFSFARLTAEFTGGANDPGRLDRFVIALLNSAGSSIVQIIHDSTVADTSFAPVPSGFVSTPAGDGFFEMTPWVQASLTGLSGSYRIAFAVSDLGDNSFDSAFLIDGQRTTIPGTTVPEPGVTFLLSAGVLASITFGNRARKVSLQVKKERAI